jgi:alpha-D-ribose 1-methylphosphonate 5-triphosphate synthase subunit PhnH
MEQSEILYSQTTFRQCLMAMANPGTLHRIAPSPVLPDSETLSPYLAGLALTLLDQEVSFHVHHGVGTDIAFLQLHTLGRLAEAAACDYFLANGKEPFHPLVFKKGDLLHPDQSCTVLCQVRQLSTAPVSSECSLLLKLSGPGIAEETNVYVDGLWTETVAQWKEMNQEYPLGIDWILADDEGQLCAIPRSCRLEFTAL